MRQETLAGILLCALGLGLLLVPADRLWSLTEKWKTEGEAKPSRAYSVLLRIVGAAFAAAGAALAAGLF